MVTVPPSLVAPDAVLETLVVPAARSRKGGDERVERMVGLVQRENECPVALDADHPPGDGTDALVDEDETEGGIFAQQHFIPG